MDDGVVFFIWVALTLVFSLAVIAIIDCIEKRQRRQAEDVALAVGFAVAAGVVRKAEIALTILDHVSLPRQQQSGASAGEGSTTAADRPECVFCLGELEDGEEWVVLTVCIHEFHRECMAKWLEQRKISCPTCRAVLRPGVSQQTAPALADMV
ncbi:unnamed protein product [Alopecurus aequalis]